MFVKSKNRKTKDRYKFDIGRKKIKMWQKLVTATISALLIVIPLANGLYFHIAETERKCFIEEIPDETMVTGTKKFLSKYFLIINRSCSVYRRISQINYYRI